MKRIGILTFHRSINYGAYMQCLSLSHYLSINLKNCKVEVIDYESKIMHDVYLPKFSLVSMKHPIIHHLSKIKYKRFSESLRFLPLSEKHFISDGENSELSDYIMQNYDVVVVGSDAVWNWVKRGFPNPYLLGLPYSFKKLSYAASAYGMPMDYVGEKEKEYFSNSLKDFSFIGVRDEYTRSLVECVCPKAKTSFTCDPTIFLDLQYVRDLLNHTEESYKKYIYEKFGLPKDKKLIGIMESDNKIVKAIRKKYNKTHYVVCVYNCNKDADKFIGDLNPLEWSLIFGLFDITVTNYFHGTLLSLRNNTPVISIDLTEFSKNYEGKIHDVMRRMDLLDCFFNSESNTTDIINQIDYVIKNKSIYKNKISNNIIEMSKSSMDFLDYLRDILL